MEHFGKPLLLLEAVGNAALTFVANIKSREFQSKHVRRFIVSFSSSIQCLKHKSYYNLGSLFRRAKPNAVDNHGFRAYNQVIDLIEVKIHNR